MKKGAVLTTYISLPGRFVVLMPGSENRTISRKITDEKERERLKKIAQDVSLPGNLGLIIRTAGINQTKIMLTKDIRYLTRVWKEIQSGINKKKAPALLYEESNIALRAIRDSFTEDTSEILIDDPDVFKEVKNFINLISPKHIKIVKQYKGSKPIFTKHQLEEQIASVYKNRVKLKSGGSIVITQTEALVAIDVNSGKATDKTTVEQTALQSNIEAAREIARQLRLRDLGGLIVIDFIDMRDKKHKTTVEKKIKEHLKKDKAKTKVGRLSMFGLLEMSRQRIRPSIEFGSFISCPQCQGKGLVPSKETLGLSFLRKLNSETLKKEKNVATCRLPSNVAQYLLNKKRKELVEFEERRNMRIIIEADSVMIPTDFKITYSENKECLVS